MGMMPMRRAALLIIAFIIIGSLPPTAGKAVEAPTQRDVFLYDYFSQVLTRFEYSLRYALANESYSLTLANTTFQELELLHEESLYYGEKGVNLTVMHVLPPFYEFSKQLMILDELTLQFQTGGDPELAAGILGTAGKMEALLDAIEGMKLRNGTEVLVFDTSGVRKRLEEIKALASKVPQTGEFTLGVSDRNPMLNGTVTIFGTCPLNGTVTIVITDGSSTALLAVMPSNGFFSKEYRFEELGTYEIYATQGGERSNTVSVTVGKISTAFVVDGTYSTFINGTIELRGKLVDYYGRPLGERNVSIGNSTVVTGPDGDFSRRYRLNRAGTIKVTLTFGGDEVHEGTSRVVTLVFRKYPVSIGLDGPTETAPGKEVAFEGTIDPALEVPLTVYINGSPAFNVTPSNGTFSFTITPEKPGTLEIHVEFPGSDVYAGASSNVIVLAVIPPESMAARYLVIGVLTVALVAAVIVMRKREETGGGGRGTSHQTPSRDEGPAPMGEPVYVPDDVGEAYRLLRRRLRDAFGVGENLTPREALRALEGWKLYPVLERVTLLHEKAVYGEVELGEDEIREFREGVEKLLGGDGR
ncbi:hypothetical protein GQS_06020 [Thermococcus sp. 4557]|nr:hypothetical protein GQS_06020 [Thermococcus sp. 4557]